MCLCGQWRLHKVRRTTRHICVRLRCGLPDAQAHNRGNGTAEGGRFAPRFVLLRHKLGHHCEHNTENGALSNEVLKVLIKLAQTLAR
jgi:hypothetical protein